MSKLRELHRKMIKHLYKYSSPQQIFFMILGISVILIITYHGIQKDKSVKWVPYPIPVMIDFQPEQFKLNNRAEESGIPSLSRWPPSNPAELIDPATGYYDMRIRPKVNLANSNQSFVQQYVLYLGERFKDQFGGSTKLSDVAHMDWNSRFAARGDNYDLYPQWIDIQKTIQAVKNGDPVDQNPINEPVLQISEIPKHVCNQDQKQYDLIVMTKSCAYCFEKRQRARQSHMRPELWTNFSIGFVFVIGSPIEEQEQHFNFDGVEIRFPKGSWSFSSGKPDENRQLALQMLRNESDKYGDLLIGSFLDTYYNLTLKQMMSFRWASIFCRNLTPLFMYMDDDYALIPQNLIKTVQSIPDGVKLNIAGGRQYDDLRVHRPNGNPYYNKYALSYQEFPWSTYPSYPLGFGYLLGAQIVEEVAIASAFTRNLRIDDCYLGLVFHKLRKVFVTLGGFVMPIERVQNKNYAVCVQASEANQFYDWTTGKFK